jgi:D-tyrosyl-tRNA(Tyr) deacylase
MRVVLQRVREARVEVAGKVVGQISKGLLLLVGVEEADDEEDVAWLLKKITQCRIFSDEEGKMNLSVREVEGQLLVISQFTLHASTKKGNRPSFIRAAHPAKAEALYQTFVKEAGALMGEAQVQSGIFGADMQVHLLNDGPVTLWFDSKNKE